MYSPNRLQGNTINRMSKIRHTFFTQRCKKRRVLPVHFVESKLTESDGEWVKSKPGFNVRMIVSYGTTCNGVIQYRVRVFLLLITSVFTTPTTSFSSIVSHILMLFLCHVRRRRSSLLFHVRLRYNLLCALRERRWCQSKQARRMNGVKR